MLRERCGRRRGKEVANWDGFCLQCAMRVARTVLLVLGLIALGFGYWGAVTPSGHRVFHEWEVVLPIFVGCVGTFLLLVAGILWLVDYMRRSRQRE